MSINDEYNEYLISHIDSVKEGYEWLKENIPELFKPITNIGELDKQIRYHDASKYDDEEYEPYAEYFYGKKTQKVKEDFDYAWLHHQHNNPHHWQHWLLQNDEDGLKVLDMPYNYILEMICDWWAFSWKADNLHEIFSWYNKNKKGIILSDKTKKTVEDILDKIKENIE